jgi:rSAM/selenodomain-associated transferase 2
VQSSSQQVRLSVVVPVLNDAAALARLLGELEPPSHPEMEVIVVDGGSSDGPAAVAAAAGVRLLQAPRGRGNQLAWGAEAAAGSWLWFLHADSRDVAAALRHMLARPASLAWRPGQRGGWGRFDVTFDEHTGSLAVVAALMRLRSRATGICTGDQGIFVHRRLLTAAGGVPRQSLMEDVELSRRLKRLAAPEARTETITTSARRWRDGGVLRTIVAMWGFRLRYWLGADPERLAREYYR